MSTTRIPAAIASVAVSAVVCCAALTGCSISKDDGKQAATPGSATSTPTDTPSATPSDQPTPSPTPSPATATPSTSTATLAPAAALLAAKELPQLNASSPWTQGRTGNATSRAFGLCQKFDLLSIGALTVVERTYTAGPGTAGQQVAEFPDAQNTVRAGKVVEAWHRDCAGRVKGSHVEVRPLTDVAVPHGTAWWYLVSYERRGTEHFHSLGLVLSGSRISVLRMDHQGQHHDFPPGQDPMELAVKVASARLG